MWNTENLTVLSNVTMTIVWLVYLHLFFREHKHHNRPSLIIHHAQGCDPDALCLVVNMSKEPVHVLCVIAEVRGAKGHVRRDVSDYRRFTPDDQNVQAKLRQGPIQPGGYLTLGTFENIILGRQSIADDDEGSDDQLASLQEAKNLSLMVAVNHGPTREPIGARRQFVIERDDKGKTIVRAIRINTEQLIRRRKRKEVKRWVEAHLEPKRRYKEEIWDQVEAD